jgi:hypothetical protein
MEQNRERWRRQGISFYQMQQENICFCPPEVKGPALISVQNGVVASRVLVRGGVPVPASAAGSFGTVEDLFDRIEHGLDQDFDEVWADYDPQLGYPRRIVLDQDDDAEDEDLGIIVTLLPLR